MQTGETLPRNYKIMPHVERGMVVGLFGGSFNPPHEGHLLVADTAIRRLGLDQLWWMVTPGNPLKSLSNLAPLSERLKASEKLNSNPLVRVTAFEQGLGNSYTAKTLAYIKARHPDVHFVWVMGADNLKSFHKWQNWKTIARTFPIAVVDRPGATLSYLSSKMAKTFDFARVDEHEAQTLAFRKAPAWTFLHGPRSRMSSTEIREKHNPA
jgi:nicotinate-nucleotide adenylyltransferase